MPAKMGYDDMGMSFQEKKAHKAFRLCGSLFHSSSSF